MEFFCEGAMGFSILRQHSCPCAYSSARSHGSWCHAIIQTNRETCETTFEPIAIRFSRRRLVRPCRYSNPRDPGQNLPTMTTLRRVRFESVVKRVIRRSKKLLSFSKSIIYSWKFPLLGDNSIEKYSHTELQVPITWHATLTSGQS